MIDERAAMVLGLLAAASLAVGFLNTLFTQTVNFAADEFGVSAGAQGVAGTVVRLGIVFAIGLLLLSDHVGRRRMLVIAAFASPLLCALGAVAPVVRVADRHPGARPAASRIAMGLLIGIIVVEEMPRDSPCLRRQPARAWRRASVPVWPWCRCRSPTSAPRGWRLVYVVGLRVPRRRLRTWPAACPRAGGS